MTMPTEKPFGLAVRSNENRRTSKPLMEKRRRARINQSLSELKSLILDAVKKDNQHTRHSKLEKADILEMTVRHLQNLHRQRSIINAADPLAINKFRAGYSECAREVSRFVGRMEGTDPMLCSRIINHITGCMSSLGEIEVTGRISSKQPISNGCPLSPSRPSSNESCSSGSYISSTASSMNPVRIEIPSSSSSPSPDGLVHFQSSSPHHHLASTDSCRILIPTSGAVQPHSPGIMLTQNSSPANSVPVITSRLPNGQLTLIVPNGAYVSHQAADFQPSSPLNLVTSNRDDVQSTKLSRMNSPLFLSRSSPPTPNSSDRPRSTLSAYAKEYHSDSETSSGSVSSSRIRFGFVTTSAEMNAVRSEKVIKLEQPLPDQQGENVWRPW